jgi:signal transduction histidine kinase
MTQGFTAKEFHILIIEDNPTDLKLLEGLVSKLTLYRPHIECVGSVREAFNCIESNDYDLLLLDLNLPDSQGLTTLAKFRNVCPYIPIIIISGQYNHEMGMEAISNGAQDYLVKGEYNAKMLSKSIYFAIERKKVEKSLKIAAKDLATAEIYLRQKLSELEKLNHDLQSTQEQLVQSEKMAGLGQLAAGVAHEINNPMGYIMTNLNTLNDYISVLNGILAQYDSLSHVMKSGEIEHGQEVLNKIDELVNEKKIDFIVHDIDDLLKETKEGAKRVKDIVLELKNFARMDKNELVPININQSLESTIKVAWNEIRYKCKLHKTFSDVPVIQGFPSQIGQVFLNIIVNAAQSIEEYGDVFIETTSTENDVIITISDSGKGIPQSHLKNIFTPFFTTKAPGEGTGLGLSIAYNIIQEHHGEIRVESELGKGTTFIILLPINSPHSVQEHHTA